MKIATLLVMTVFSLMIVQNAHGATVEPLGKAIISNLDSTINLGIGDTAMFSDGMAVTVLNITDSRCPADVVCVWAGEVKVFINVQKDSQELGNFSLSSIAGAVATQHVDKYSITMNHVMPYPYASKEILPSDYVISLMVSQTKPLSPLKQFKSGITIDKIVCPTGLELVMKKSNGHPACVKPESVSKLIQRGWADHVLPDYVKDEEHNSDIFEQGSFQVTNQTVTYFENTDGFLSMPVKQGNYPGVIMIHEWWGLNDNIKNMAANLASHGYTVLAVDLYGGQVATTSDGARELVTTFNVQKGMENIGSAAQFLRENYKIEKLATIGWCFGGSQSFNYALSGQKLDATVIYYGQVSSDKSELAKITWPVLGIFGELDQSITKESVMEFESALDDLGITNEIQIYPGVNHAFANPSGANYSPEETKDAWEKTITFLETYLQ